MTKPNIIQRGESFPFVFDRGDESIDGWTCAIFVKIFPSGIISISRAITPKDGAWSGFLTADETASLSVNQQILTARLTNATTGETEEQSIKFYVSTAWTVCIPENNAVDKAIIGCAIVG